MTSAGSPLTTTVGYQCVEKILTDEWGIIFLCTDLSSHGLLSVLFSYF